MTGPDPDAVPLISVMRGQPTDAELAAVVTVLGLASTAVSSAPVIQTTAKLSPWSNKSFLLRQPIAPGPDAWHRSAS
jgi:hypothetical protein